MKHIGILAHSAEGSALCYLTACHEGARALGEHMHPNITMDIVAMGETLPEYERDDFPPIKKVLGQSAARLAGAGCDFFVCPDNTAHLALEAEGDPLPLPGLHIAGVVADNAKAQGFTKIGILGTKWTMNGPIYRNAFRAKGMDFVVPNEDDIALINTAIFGELCQGVFKDRTVAEFLHIIEGLKAAGCDAVVLGCTEIPLIVTPENSPLPTLDSTRLLAREAVAVALGNKPMPTWRGEKLYS